MKRILLTTGVVFATWILASIVLGVIFAVTGLLESDHVDILAGSLMGIILITVGVFTWQRL